MTKIQISKRERVKLDTSVKSPKTPSPLMGEGRGEGENTTISSSYVPLPFIPSHQGRGNPTFYETVKLFTIKLMPLPWC